MHWTAGLRCCFIFHINGPPPVMHGVRTMRRAAIIVTLFGLLAIAFGLTSCYQAQNFRTPSMYPGSDGGDGLWETRIIRFLASVFIGVTALCVANYLRWQANRNANKKI